MTITINNDATDAPRPVIEKPEPGCHCDCADLLGAMLPYAVASLNDDRAAIGSTLTRRGIADIGSAMRPLTDDAEITSGERDAARRLIGGLDQRALDALIGEVGARAVARALLGIRATVSGTAITVKAIPSNAC